MGLFDLFKKNHLECDIKKDGLIKTIAPILPSGCKRLCSISKNNDSIEKVVRYKIKREFEEGYDSYSILLNPTDGTMFFVHNTLEHVGAAYDTQVRFATTISFENVKSLLLYEADYYRELIERWEQNNDTDRANLCKEGLQEIEKIVNTSENNWRELADL